MPAGGSCNILSEAGANGDAGSDSSSNMLSEAAANGEAGGDSSSNMLSEAAANGEAGGDSSSNMLSEAAANGDSSSNMLSEAAANGDSSSNMLSEAAANGEAGGDSNSNMLSEAAANGDAGSNMLSEAAANGDAGRNMLSEAAANGDAGRNILTEAVAAPAPSLRDIGFDMDADTKTYVPLYIAANKCDWDSAINFISQYPEAPEAIISIYKWTALHVACRQGHSTFVEKLIPRMRASARCLRDVFGCTALHYAAKSGSFKCLKALLDVCPELTLLADKEGYVPLIEAAKIPITTHPRQKDLVWQLILVTKQQLDNNLARNSPFVSPAIGQQLLTLLISNEYLDITFYLVMTGNMLGNRQGSILRLLIDQPSVFQSQSRLGFWENIISYLFVSIPLEPENIAPRAWLHAADQQPPPSPSVLKRIREWLRSTVTAVLQLTREWLWRSTVTVVPALNRIYEEKSKHIYALALVKEAFSTASSTMDNEEMLMLLHREDPYNILPLAAFHGILEIYTTCFEFFPDAFGLPSTSGSRLLKACVEYRQEKIFNFFLENMAQLDFMYNCIFLGDTIMHIVAKLPPSAKPNAMCGSAFKMQKELQWYKALEKICHSVYHTMLNNDKRTPREVFTEEHKELLAGGEKWMKDTANSCMLVATLIATVVFAAAFTVPGGNNQNGLPLFSHKTSFLIFAISDALALFSSSTSILIFLSILTSRFMEEDFLVSLPRKLIIGLASLFIAIVTMMVAFGATFCIVLGHRFPRPWVIIPAVILPACVPVGLFMRLQLPLFIQMVKSTFWSNIPWR